MMAPYTPALYIPRVEECRQRDGVFCKIFKMSCAMVHLNLHPDRCPIQLRQVLL